MIAIQKVHSFTDAFNYNDKKLNLPDKTQRAELLDHNFLNADREAVLQEIKMINSLHSNRMKNDGYHVALSFSENDKISNDMLKSIADDYKKGMGFDGDHLFLLYKHNDGDDHKHIHVHLLLHRLSIDPETGKTKLVSDSNNYQRSEKLCRQIERKYGLETVRSSKGAQDRAPNKDELEMIQRTGNLSNRMLMQVRTKDALSKSNNIQDFITQCKQNGIHLIFNQSESTGRVSGITYISVNGFIAKGQKLGNQFKWSNLIKQLKYEQSRDRQAIGETNRDTRERFKDLLNQGDRGIEIRNGETIRKSEKYHKESTHFTSNDGYDFQDRGKSGFNSHSERANNNEETEQEYKETVSNQFSTGASTITSGLSGLLGSIGGDEVDEDEKRRKRRFKR